MNRETLRAGLFTLLAGSIPRNVRRISCAYYDDQPQRNALGLRVDPQPIEGRVVAITDEAFIVKTARTSFAAVDRELATRCPRRGRQGAGHALLPARLHRRTAGRAQTGELAG